MSALSTIIARGTTASRPAAGNPGRIYYCTDSTIGWYRDNGSSWDACEPTSLSDPTSNRGEIIRRGAAGLEALQAKTAGKALIGDGTDIISTYPPGYELDFAQITSPPTITATVEASADTIISGASVSYDGAPVIVEFTASSILLGSTASQIAKLWLFVDGSSVGAIRYVSNNSTASGIRHPASVRLRYTPSAGSHTISIRGTVSSGSFSIECGSGGAAAHNPGQLRITKA